MLQFLQLQRVGHDLVTEQQQMKVKRNYTCHLTQSHILAFSVVLNSPGQKNPQFCCSYYHLQIHLLPLFKMRAATVAMRFFCSDDE